MRPSEEDRRSHDAPVVTPSSADTTPEEAEAETAALCAAYEAQWRLWEDGECQAGCDCPDGALSPDGCRW